MRYLKSIKSFTLINRGHRATLTNRGHRATLTNRGHRATLTNRGHRATLTNRGRGKDFLMQSIVFYIIMKQIRKKLNKKSKILVRYRN